MAKTQPRGGQILDNTIKLDTPNQDVTGVLPAANGGTGNSTNTLNNVLLGNGTGALQTVAPGTSGNALKSNGTTWASAAMVKADVGLGNVDNTSDATKDAAATTLTNKTLTSPKINEAVALTSSATELNVLDGIPATLTATELGYVDGVTSAIQTQINAKGVGTWTDSSTSTGSNKTFVAPALGTPASGVATNITALNATQLTTGTIPDARMPNLTGDVTTVEGAVATTIGTSVVGNTQLALGVPVQMVVNSTSAVATGTTTIPQDDTIPQNTEGTEFITLAITPKSTTNVLIIEAVLQLGCSAAGRNIIAALFQDTTAGALAANLQFNDSSATILPMGLVVRHTMVAGTTSATTFKIRVGAQAAATITFNGNNSARLFGAITKSSMTITEYKAS